MTFKNEAELKRFLLEKCAKAVAKAEEEVYVTIAGRVNQFYHEYAPEEYIRTGALFNSLDSTGVIRDKNGATAEVYFNLPKYKHGWVLLQSGGYGRSTWSDEKIQNVVMTGGLPHGGYEEGTAIWIESMESLGGRNGIKNLLKQELKRQGL